MYKVKSRIIAIIMTLVMCMSQINVLMASDLKHKVNQITLTIEKFTIGQGYYMEPINLPFKEGEKLGSVISRALGSGKYNRGIDSDNIVYLESVLDDAAQAVNIPTYITSALDKEVTAQDDMWLAGGDYTNTSGWMYVINNMAPTVGMDNYTCVDGDVVRVEFSLYGYGADLGLSQASWGGPEALIAPANKDALIKLVANINGLEDKEVLLEKEIFGEGTTVGEYYNEALNLLYDMEVDQASVDTTYEKLQSVVGSIDSDGEDSDDKGDTPVTDPVEQAKLERIENILNAISAQYQEESYEWSIMDMAAYGLKDSLKQADIEKYVTDAKKLIQTSKKGTDFDKTAIIFTSLGIDPRTVTLEDGSHFDIIDYIANMKKMDLINGATFALLAYDSNNYPVVDKPWTRENVINYIKEAQRTDGGWALIPTLPTDTDITAMVLSALAPYYNAEEDLYDVKECVEKGISCLSKLQGEDGLYAYGKTKNSNTAAMVIIALSALGIDADKDSRFIQNDVSALDALLHFETAEHKIGYTDTTKANNMATEQGFRALVNYKAFKEGQGPAYVYQFITKPVAPMETPQPTISPEPTVTPQPTISPESTVTPEPTTTPQPTTTPGHSSGGSDTPATITVTFRLMGDSHHEEATAHKEYETWIPKTTYTVPKNATVKDVFEKALGEAGISYINRDGNYVSSINGLAEFDNGPNSGWMYMINGKHPNLGLKEYVLQGGETIVWHYTDDYTKEEGSEAWGSKPSDQPQSNPATSGGGGGRATSNACKEEGTTPEVQRSKEVDTTESTPMCTIDFEDVKESHWAKEAIIKLAAAGILQGKKQNQFMPSETLTRAELITMLYRMSGESYESTETLVFNDVKTTDWYGAAIGWGLQAGIIKGMNATSFAPQAPVTREQIATMVAKYIQYMKLELVANESKVAFKDAASISEYAKASVQTLQQYNILKGKADSTFAPKDKVTRAEAAQILIVIFKQNEK